MRKNTWLATVVCIVLVVPSIFVGGFATLLYRVLMASVIGSQPDFYALRTIFGIETPGLIIKWIVFNGLGSIFHGAVGGAIAAVVTGLICKGANVLKSSCLTGFVYTGFVVVLIALGLAIQDFNLKTLEMVCQLVGLWWGLLVGSAAFHKAQTAVRTQ